MVQQEFLFETERLYLNPTDPAHDADIKATLSLYQSKGAHEAFGDSIREMDYNQCKQRLQTRWEKHYLPRGFGSFLIFQKPSPPDTEPHMVGMCSMIQELSADFPDVGYALADEATGKGYATEAVQGLIQHCREHCGVKDVTGITKAGNSPSRRVLERLGMKLVATVVAELMGNQQETVVYALGLEAEGRSAEYYQTTTQERFRLLEIGRKPAADGLVPMVNEA